MLPLALAVLVMCMVAIPVLAEPAKSPLKQYMAGVLLEDIQCMSGRTLMESPSGNPICVTANSAARLAGIGYVDVKTQDMPPPDMGTDTGADPTADDGLDVAGDGPLQTVSALEIESAVIPQSMADANNEFMFDFYGQVSDNTDNIFFSPTGMYGAFSMLYEGARNNTALQMEDVFGFEPDDTLRHNATAHMISSINREDPDATLEIANAMWVGFDAPEPYIHCRS